MREQGGERSWRKECNNNNMQANNIIYYSYERERVCVFFKIGTLILKYTYQYNIIKQSYLRRVGVLTILLRLQPKKNLDVSIRLL